MFINPYIIYFMSIVFCLMDTLLFLIHLIFIFSFLLIGLVRSLLVLLICSNSQFLFCWFSLLFVYFLFQLFPLTLFSFSTLVLICCLFLGFFFFRVKPHFSYYLPFIFSKHAPKGKNFLPGAALATVYKLDLLCFHFQNLFFIQNVFYFCCDFWSMNYLEVFSIRSQIIVVFQITFCYWFQI